MNIEHARTNMIQQQLRTWDILETHVLNVIESTPREDFVPKPYRKLAFADTCIPLAHDQVMMPPREEGRMLQALAIQSSDNILEIGTGSGYVTALLARLGAHVLSIEIFSDLSRSANKALLAQGIDNATLAVGNGATEWQTETGPFDVICLTGAIWERPQHYLECLTLGGRLFAIMGQAPAMTATVFTRTEPDQWQQQILFETVIPPLIHAIQPKRFEF